jgi:2-hydroxychromene-2-carboxylate isomerase
MASIDFFYDLASSYSYIAAMRIAPLAEAAGVAVRWRPFLLGPIFKAQGYETSPFNIHQAKSHYMVRDCERQCAALGVPFRLPTPFPAMSLLAARVALVALPEGWGEEFSRAVYRAEFGEGLDISEAPVIAGILCKILAMTAQPRSRARNPMRSKGGYAPKPRRRNGSASSARRASSRAVNCSGATIGWSRRSIS